jgi:hypothetical protein
MLTGNPMAVMKLTTNPVVFPEMITSLMVIKELGGCYM